MFKKIIQYVIVGIIFVLASQVAHAVTLEELTAKVEQEITDRTNVDSLLAKSIATNKTEIEKEVSRAQVAEGVLDSKIDQEITDRTNVDSLLAKSIATNKTAIGDRQSIYSLNQKIDEAAANLSLSASIQEIGNTIGNMNFTGTRYIRNDRDISSALRTLDARVAQSEMNLTRLDNKVERQHKEMKRGFASLAALSRLVPNARSSGDTQISVAGGWYRGTTGVAVGAFHYVNNNLLVNAGLGYAGQDSLTFGVGMTFSF